MFGAKDKALSAALLSLAYSAFLSGCSLQPDSPTQFQTIDPSRRGGVEPIPIRNVTEAIHVRLFPILSTPGGEPYPVTKNLYEVRLQSSGSIRIFDQDQLVAESSSIDVLTKAGKIKLDTHKTGVHRELPLKKYVMIPTSDWTLVSWDLQNASKVSLNYRGKFALTPSYFEERRSFLWSLINVVDIEEYLFSVVPSEVPASWHPTTLEVQAVAARSYAIRQMVLAREKNREYDVDPTTQYQSYRGTGKEQPSTNVAVQNTAGQIMTFNGGVIEASFSSHSGGVTCSAAECFERVEDVPYLKPKSDAIEIETREIPVVGTWQACTTPELIQYHLARYQYLGAKVPGFSAPVLNGRDPVTVCRDSAFRNRVRTQLDPKLKVHSIAALKPTGTQRAWSLEAELAGRVPVKLARSETRTPDAKPLLPSMRTVFLGRRSHLMKLQSIEKDGVYIVQGHGFGHGVGMSQYGAQWRAEKYDHTVQQILNFYYSGIELTRLSLKSSLP